MYQPTTMHRTLNHSIKPRGSVLAVLFMAGYASADGGAPLILLINPIMFLVSLVVIVLLEGGLIKRMINCDTTKGMMISLKTNALSTLVIGIVLPIVVAFVGTLIGYGIDVIMKTNAALSLIATWVYDSRLAIRYAKIGMIIWLVVSFILTILYEAKLLQKYSLGLLSKDGSKRISIKINAITYSILATEMAVMLYLI